VVYWEEKRVLARILDALRDSYPDRVAPMTLMVTRWFTRHWRNESRDPIPESERCRLCDVQRRFGVYRKVSAFSTCSDCVRDALSLAKNPRWPSRDMVRLEALRALRASGDDEAARFVEEIAAAFPDLAREDGTCDLCLKTAVVARGARGTLCEKCLQKRVDDLADINAR